MMWLVNKILGSIVLFVLTWTVAGDELRDGLQRAFEVSSHRNFQASEGSVPGQILCYQWTDPVSGKVFRRRDVRQPAPNAGATPILSISAIWTPEGFFHINWNGLTRKDQGGDWFAQIDLSDDLAIAAEDIVYDGIPCVQYTVTFPNQRRLIYTVGTEDSFIYRVQGYGPGGEVWENMALKEVKDCYLTQSWFRPLPLEELRNVTSPAAAALAQAFETSAQATFRALDANNPNTVYYQLYDAKADQTYRRWDTGDVLTSVPLQSMRWGPDGAFRVHGTGEYESIPNPMPDWFGVIPLGMNLAITVDEVRHDNQNLWEYTVEFPKENRIVRMVYLVGKRDSMIYSVKGYQADGSLGMDFSFDAFKSCKLTPEFFTHQALGMPDFTASEELELTMKLNQIKKINETTNFRAVGTLIPGKTYTVAYQSIDPEDGFVFQRQDFWEGTLQEALTGTGDMIQVLVRNRKGFFSYCGEKGVWRNSPEYVHMLIPDPEMANISVKSISHQQVPCWEYTVALSNHSATSKIVVRKKDSFVLSHFMQDGRGRRMRHEQWDKVDFPSHFPPDLFQVPENVTITEITVEESVLPALFPEKFPSVWRQMGTWLGSLGKRTGQWLVEFFWNYGWMVTLTIGVASVSLIGFLKFKSRHSH